MSKNRAINKVEPKLIQVIDFLATLGSNEVVLGGLRNLSEALWGASGPSWGGLRRPLGRVPKTDSPDKEKGRGDPFFGRALGTSWRHLGRTYGFKID